MRWFEIPVIRLTDFSSISLTIMETYEKYVTRDIRRLLTPTDIEEALYTVYENRDVITYLIDAPFSSSSDIYLRVKGRYVLLAWRAGLSKLYYARLILPPGSNPDEMQVKRIKGLIRITLPKH